MACRPLMCWSTGRDPIAHPPGKDTFAWPKRAKQWTECQDRGAHGFDQLIRRFRICQSACIQDNAAVVLAVCHHPHIADEFEHGGYIMQMRHIGKGDGLVSQQGCAQFWQGRVFGTRNQHLALQSITTTYQEFVHAYVPAFSAVAHLLPLSGAVGAHRQSMDFVGHHAIAQSGVDALVALDQTFAFKFSLKLGWHTSDGRLLARANAHRTGLRR